MVRSRALSRSSFFFHSARLLRRRTVTSPWGEPSARRSRCGLTVLAASQPTSLTDSALADEGIGIRVARYESVLPGSWPRSRLVSRLLAHAARLIYRHCAYRSIRRHTRLVGGSRGQREPLEEASTTTLITQTDAPLSLSFFPLLPPPTLPVPPPPRFSHSREKTTRHHCAILPLSRAMPLRRSPSHRPLSANTHRRHCRRRSRRASRRRSALLAESSENP